MIITIRRRPAITLSGISWLAIGILLLTKGLQYLVVAGEAVFAGTHEGFSLISFFGALLGNPERGVFMLMGTAFVIGVLKGRLVLRKTVNRVTKRIQEFPEKFPLSSLYTKGYVILIGSMMLLGMLFKFLPLPLDVKGFIDFTVGVALINGAFLYFRKV